MLPRSLSPFRRINLIPFIFICIATYVTHRIFSSRDPRVTVLTRLNHQPPPSTGYDLRDNGPHSYRRDDGPQLDVREDGPQPLRRDDGQQFQKMEPVLRFNVKDEGKKLQEKDDGQRFQKKEDGQKLHEKDDGQKHQEKDDGQKHQEKDIVQKHQEKDDGQRNQQKDNGQKLLEKDDGQKHQEKGIVQKHQEKDDGQKHQEKDDGLKHKEKDDGQKHPEKYNGQKHHEKENGQKHQEKDDGQRNQQKDNGQKHQEKYNGQKHQEKNDGQKLHEKNDGQRIQERKLDEKIDDVDNFEMAARRNLVLQYCNGSAKDPPRFARWIRSRAHQFFHCPVEKTASTFWRRFTYQLEFTHPMRSPFDINATYIYSVAKDTITVKEKGEELKKLWNQSIKQLYVRDPYSRLFSAYVDKILAPNPVFWGKWGQPSISKYRNTTLSRKCADDVTFSEFVSYALSDPGQADPHMQAIYNLCTPCAVNYTIIGKMETFRRDTLQLLALLNITEEQMELDRMPRDVSSDAVTDSVTDSLSPSWLNSTLRCITKENVIRRIWRKLQIRGIISWRKRYDLDLARAQHMDSKRLIAHMENLMSTSTNLTELKLQKRQAMLEAFASLKSSHFEKIKKVYKNDFLMFGYEPNMEALLSAQPIKITGALDWWKDWDMTSVLV